MRGSHPETGTCFHWPWVRSYVSCDITYQIRRRGESRRWREPARSRRLAGGRLLNGTKREHISVALPQIRRGRKPLPIRLFRPVILLFPKEESRNINGLVLIFFRLARAAGSGGSISGQFLAQPRLVDLAGR